MTAILGVYMYILISEYPACAMYGTSTHIRLICAIKMQARKCHTCSTRGMSQQNSKNLLLNPFENHWSFAKTTNPISVNTHLTPKHGKLRCHVWYVISISTSYIPTSPINVQLPRLHNAHHLGRWHGKSWPNRLHYGSRPPQGADEVPSLI